MIVLFHIISFALGFVMDLILGDPRFLPHPVQFIGALIGKLDNSLYSKKNTLFRGGILCFLVCLISTGITALIVIVGYKISLYVGVIVEAILTWQILATKSLKSHSLRVYDKLQEKDIDAARYAVSMIVGRDTDSLDSKGIIKATIETVAENTSDGIIAPMIYTGIGTPILGMLYKSINTMDSMIGYKNERYILFGRAAAKLDDIVNYLPSRIAAYLMIIATFFSGLNTKGAIKVYARDKDKSESPNASKCESVAAGALNISLLGDAYYFGKLVEKQSIGDDIRPVEKEDIKRINRLMYITSILCFLLILILLFVLECII